MTRENEIRNAYELLNSRSTIIAGPIAEKAVDRTSTSLVLHGRGTSPYGIDRNQNLVHLLENFANTSGPSNPIDGQFWWDTTNSLLMVWDETIGSPLGSWERIVPANVGVGFSVVAGAGLTGGGLPTGSPLTTTLNVGAGTGITIGGSPSIISTNDPAIDHDSLDNFDPNEHIDHTSVDLIAGAGLAGGGTLNNASITFIVSDGDGIDVSNSPPSVSVDSTVVRTFGNQSIGTDGAITTFTDPILGKNNQPAGNPSYAFDTDANTGMYRSSSNQISFATNAVQRFRIQRRGVLRSIQAGASQGQNYEDLVTDDNDIPNKQYVDDHVGDAESVTQNTFIGVSTIGDLFDPSFEFPPGNVIGKAGPLDGNQTYYVTVYGILPPVGTGFTTLAPIQLFSVGDGVGERNQGGLGTLIAQTPAVGQFDWMDGDWPSSASFIAEMNGDTKLNCMINPIGYNGWKLASSYMVAFQISNN